jgi:hypothetical protein
LALPRRRGLLLQGARELLYMPLAVIIGSRCPPHAYAEV